MHFLLLIAFTAFLMLIAILFRNLASALVTSYLYIIIMTIILPADGNLVRYELNWNVINFGVFEPAYSNWRHGILVGLTWLVVSLVLGVVIFKKQDIK